MNTLGNGPLRVRTARPEDADRIKELADQLGYPRSVEQFRTGVAQLGEDENHVILVAESDAGQVVGWVHAYVRASLLSEFAAELGALVVDETLRGNGIGRELTRRAEAWACRRGCRSIGVRTNVLREDAYRFYTSAGYDLVKSQRVLRRALAPDASA